MGLRLAESSLHDKSTECIAVAYKKILSISVVCGKKT